MKIRHNSHEWKSITKEEEEVDLVEEEIMAITITTTKNNEN